MTRRTPGERRAVAQTPAGEGDPSSLAAMFRRFADTEFHGSSPAYAYLSRFLAEHPGLARPLLAARPSQRRALLYLAAAQYVVRTRDPGHPLAGYLPVLGGDRTPDPGLAAAFAALAETYAHELASLCASRTTQTNEPARCALLRPALAYAAAGRNDRPIALIDLGTSAGLLLIPDRYAYRYPREPVVTAEATAHDGTASRTTAAPPDASTYGRAEAPSTLTMTCAIRGSAPPTELLATGAVIGRRIGLDLSPVNATDTAATTWLRCCVWPEHTDRLRRLEAALAEAATVPRTLLSGDLVDLLPRVLADLPPDVFPVITSSNTLVYLSPDRRRRLAAFLARAGTGRDLAVVLNEAASCGLHLFTDGRPERPAAAAEGTLTVVGWHAGRTRVDALATTGPHGAWLSWHPRGYPPVTHH